MDNWLFFQLLKHVRNRSANTVGPTFYNQRPGETIHVTVSNRNRDRSHHQSRLERVKVFLSTRTNYRIIGNFYSLLSLLILNWAILIGMCRVQLLQLVELFKFWWSFRSASWCQNESQCLTIEFEDAEAAAQFVERQQIMPNDIRRYERMPKVMCAICRKLPRFAEEKFTNPMLQPPEEDSPNNILNAFDNNCLREIFDRTQQVSDFYSIANVCVRFNTISKESFALKFKNTTVWLNEITILNPVSLKHVEQFLCMFGASIESLGCNPETFRTFDLNTVSELISQHCPNLQHLNIFIPRKCEEMPSHLPLGNLKSLDITFGQGNWFPDFMKFLVNCSQLESLKLRCDYFRSTLLMPLITLPKLTKLKFKYWISWDQEHPPALEFVERNPQLKHLHIPNTLDLCEIIRDKMPNLRKLKISHARKPDLFLMHLRGLKHLVVKISGVEELINDAPMALDNVTSVQIEIYLPPEERFIVNLGQRFRNLKRLTISWYPGDSDLCDTTGCTLLSTVILITHILLNVHQLIELHLILPDKYILDFGEVIYKDILETVKNRMCREKLHIIVEGSKIYRNKKNMHRRRLNLINLEPEWLSILTIRSDNVFRFSDISYFLFGFIVLELMCVIIMCIYYPPYNVSTKG